MPQRITPARRPGDLVAVRSLLHAYFDQLRDHVPAADAEAELASLPGQFGAPGGVLLVAWDAEKRPVGCVGVRPLGVPGTCELKRLYVSEEGRGLGMGRALLTAAVEAAATIPYGRMVLDTLPTMEAAAALYRSAGFQPIGAYAEAATPGLLCFARDLRPGEAGGTC